MASQEWITGSDLGEFEEEKTLPNIVIEYRPTVDSTKKTLEPILLSSNLPSGITLTLADNSIKVMGTTPRVDEDVTYYFTYRLKEVEIDNTSHVTAIDDRYFSLTVKNKAVTWRTDANYYISINNNNLLELNLIDYLDHPNGNETFRKVSGTLPDGVNFDDNGTIAGYVEEDITDITEYGFSVRVYSNGRAIENLEDKDFVISVDPEIMEQKPVWISEPNLGNVNKNDYLSNDPNDINSKRLSAQIINGANGFLQFELATPEDPNNTEDITGLPPGLTLLSSGYIVGTCTTTQVKDWYFGAYAVKIIEEEDNISRSDYRKFFISTNRGSSEHEIKWVDEDKVYSLGTFVIGEELSLQLPIATSADGSMVRYSLSGNKYPKGIELSTNGLISGKLDLQDTGAYDFEVMAKTDFTYITRKFRMSLKPGLSESALKLYLRINLEYKDQYTEIKDQLNLNTLYNNDIDTYNVSNFPKIDVATLKCYDREVLASMLNFGNPEIVRFGLTKSLPYSHIDGNGNLTANYEVFYKSIDENTYQWDPIECGNYDFQAKLDQLKTTGEIVDTTTSKTELEFNNEEYTTSVKCSLFLGEVETYAKLLTCNTSELKKGYYAKVLRDENHDDETAYYIYNGNSGSTLMWVYNKELPQEVLVETSPKDSYHVFNFKNVRNLLSQNIYVKRLEGTFYYDEGNQQIITDINDEYIPSKILKKIYDEYGKPKFDKDKSGTFEWCLMCDDESGESSSDESTDNTNETPSNTSSSEKKEVMVKYRNHTVYDDSGRIYANILFKPDFGSPNFMIYVKSHDESSDEDPQLYHVSQITNPWCFDFEKNTNISIDTVPVGAEMVMPNIKTSDVNFLLGGSPYVTFLDTSIEPLPMWKRKQAEVWKPNTTYKAKEIIIYNSLYYKVKQQFTTGNEFIYDTNLLELINGDVIDVELPKNYFPSLDLGYYYSGTNRKYLKDLNDAEKRGEFWYRKDFLFWELIAEPVYNHEIDTFGIPFYSTQNRMELVNKDRKTRRTFEIVCDTPNAEVSIIINGDDVINTPSVWEKYEFEQNGNKWKIKFDIGSTIKWSVTAGDNYYPEGGEYIIVTDERHVINLKKKCVITIYPNPADATVLFDVPGYTAGEWGTVWLKALAVTNNRNLMEDGIYYINYDNPSEVFADGVKVYNELYDSNLERAYFSSSLYYRCIDTNDEEREKRYIIDVPNLVEFTVVANPADAEIVLEAEGYHQVGNSILVEKGTVVTYSVSKQNYATQAGSSIINENKTLNVTLQERYATLTIVPDPETADVVLSCAGYMQEGNSITVDKNKTVSYTVTALGYSKEEGYVVVTANRTLPVSLRPYVSLTVTAAPAIANANILLEAEGYEQIDNTIYVDSGVTVRYTITAEGYETVTGTQKVTSNMTLPFTLKRLYKYTVNATPNTANIVLTCSGYTQVDNYIIVPENSIVSYTITADGYYDKTGSVSITASKTDTFDLIKIPTLTVVPTPDTATVTLTCEGYEQVDNHITVDINKTVHVLVQNLGYFDEERDVTVTADETLEITMEKGSYIDIEDYEFVDNSRKIMLNKYVGSDSIIVTPHLDDE